MNQNGSNRQSDFDAEYDPVIIRNNRLQVGCIFWQSVNLDGAIQVGHL